MFRVVFNRFTNIFSPTPQSTSAEPTTMETPMFASIRQMKNGKFRLLENGNEVVGTYSRKRDAIRGASRRGLTVA